MKTTITQALYGLMILFLLIVLCAFQMNSQSIVAGKTQMEITSQAFSEGGMIPAK
jgi:hypothetical protein